MKFTIFYVLMFFSATMHSQLVDEKQDFQMIEYFLVTDNCNNINGSIDRKECVRKELNNFFSENYNYDLIDKLSNGRYLIEVGFYIKEDGNISKVNINTKNSLLKSEIERIMKLFPNNFKLIDEKGERLNGNFQFSLNFIIG